MKTLTRRTGLGLAAWAMLATCSTMSSVVPTPAHAQEATPAAAAVAASAPAAPSAAGRATVWFDAQFDTQGQVTELKPVEATRGMAGFMAPLVDIIRKSTRITPMQQEGQPATFRTGMRVVLATNAAGQPTGLVDLKMTPLVLEQSYAAVPNVSGRNGWDGEVTVSCTVSIEGKCGDITVKALPGMPETIRRWARVSVAAWRFQPQLVNGKPVTAEVTQTLNLAVSEETRPADFRDGRRL